MVTNVDAAVEAVGKLSSLSRDRVRQRFDERFTARRMAHDHLAVYRQLGEAAAPRLRKVTGLRVVAETPVPALRAEAG